MVRIVTTLLICAFFLPAIPAGAIETTKASALLTKEMRGNHSNSFKQSPSQSSASADPCLPYLHVRHYSPGAPARSPSERPAYRADKKAASVAVGLFLGARLALGPKEIVKPSQRVQIGPEIRYGIPGRDRSALGVAAYRQCKSNRALRTSQ